MLKQMLSLLKRQEGQALSEYGLLVALLAIVAVVALLILGPNLQEVFDTIAGYLVEG